ncbi:MAG: phenylacetate-coenzyme A ligase PaaK-like adenylate-forming protein [Marivirga sp.]|jgi:phenylacetate-coenzyme A ligase PaaK-like adenylate-forming protein
MSERERFKSEIDAINAENFENFALQLFQFQYKNNKIYKKYVDAIGRIPENVRKIADIPFLPIEFFKTQKIVLDDLAKHPTTIFESSGTTTNVNSKHHVFDLSFYLDNCRRIFECTYGALDDYVILALLPSYLERDNSSLVAMVNFFVEQTASSLSGFYLYNYQELIAAVSRIKETEGHQKKIIIWGVSFALLDIAEQYKVDFSDCIIMETGGMKGRRAELTRETLHDQLVNSFQVKAIHSEYGMTELLSQCYSRGEGLFSISSTMRILTREVNDPFAINTQADKAGGINIIDLANIDSCAFIETKDIGKVHSNGDFEVLGRFDYSDIRGCNLLIS